MEVSIPKEMLRIFTTIALFCFMLSASDGQTRKLVGRLTAFNTFPIYNMEVNSQKAKDLALTDSSGWFSIDCRERDVIRIKSKVFQSVSIRVNEDTDTLLLNLVFIDTKSNRQVATGYGYMSEEDLTFAMNHLERKNNDFCNYNNIFDLIEGRFPGVMVESSGSGGSVTIRGSRSAGASTRALMVVDGIITNNIGWINPCDVNSIDIIKDGMTAMYGSEGGNGVVVIETIHGSLH